MLRLLNIMVWSEEVIGRTISSPWHVSFKWTSFNFIIVVVIIVFFFCCWFVRCCCCCCFKVKCEFNVWFPCIYSVHVMKSFYALSIANRTKQMKNKKKIRNQKQQQNMKQEWKKLNKRNSRKHEHTQKNETKSNFSVYVVLCHKRSRREIWSFNDKFKDQKSGELSDYIISFCTFVIKLNIILDLRVNVQNQNEFNCFELLLFLLKKKTFHR